MNELKTLQEVGDKLFNEEFSVTRYGTTAQEFHEGEGLKPEVYCSDEPTPEQIKDFIHQERQKSFTLGIMKGVELVEGKIMLMSMTGEAIDTNGYQDVINRVIAKLSELKQELK